MNKKMTASERHVWTSVFGSSYTSRMRAARAAGGRIDNERITYYSAAEARAAVEELRVMGEESGSNKIYDAIRETTKRPVSGAGSQPYMRSGVIGNTATQPTQKKSDEKTNNETPSPRPAYPEDLLRGIGLLTGCEGVIVRLPKKDYMRLVEHFSPYSLSLPGTAHPDTKGWRVMDIDGVRVEMIDE